MGMAVKGIRNGAKQEAGHLKGCALNQKREGLQQSEWQMQSWEMLEDVEMGHGSLWRWDPGSQAAATVPSIPNMRSHPSRHNWNASYVSFTLFRLLAISLHKFFWISNLSPDDIFKPLSRSILPFCILPWHKNPTDMSYSFPS